MDSATNSAAQQPRNDPSVYKKTLKNLIDCVIKGRISEEKLKA